MDRISKIREFMSDKMCRRFFFGTKNRDLEIMQGVPGQIPTEYMSIPDTKIVDELANFLQENRFGTSHSKQVIPKPSNDNKVITITGADLCGKATQAAILAKSFEAEEEIITSFAFPRYDTAIGKIMGAMLDNSSVLIGPGDNMSKLRGGSFNGILRKGGPSYTYQLLAIANMFEVQQELADALEVGHVICDRYDIDSMAYGMLDCGDIRWIEDVQKALIPSDIVFVMDSSGHRRLGEKLDDNEKDKSFQNGVRANFRKLACEYGWNLIDCDAFKSDDKIDSAYQIAVQINTILHHKYSMSPTLTINMVEEVFNGK